MPLVVVEIVGGESPIPPELTRQLADALGSIFGSAPTQTWVRLFFWRTQVCFTPRRRPRRMHLLLGLALVSCVIWIAENLGTVARAWIYPHQREAWRLVAFDKITSWFLLMQLSFVLIYVLRTIERTIAPTAKQIASQWTDTQEMWVPARTRQRGCPSTDARAFTGAPAVSRGSRP